ncbi:hypothetical protein IFM89_001577 [Coptis chinensis]|uniref:Endonuclease/exonuclease/phosphatase domain-containing protein n=1 Tax=Coptis chinensis TaxID=261450 RepID=A0A835HZB7_9MAGN|nr:hypothetical protein IFM89_001577 [Coptis chinensis]
MRGLSTDEKTSPASTDNMRDSSSLKTKATKPENVKIEDVKVDFWKRLILDSMITDHSLTAEATVFQEQMDADMPEGESDDSISKPFHMVVENISSDYDDLYDTEKGTTPFIMDEGEPSKTNYTGLQGGFVMHVEDTDDWMWADFGIHDLEATRLAEVIDVDSNSMGNLLGLNNEDEDNFRSVGDIPSWDGVANDLCSIPSPPENILQLLQEIDNDPLFNMNIEEPNLAPAGAPLSMMQQTGDSVGPAKENRSLTFFEKVDVEGTTEELIYGTHNPTQSVATSNRGMGSKDIVNNLRSLVKQFNHDVLFLAETKLFFNKFMYVRKSLKFSRVFVVDPVGSSGGLAVLYKDNIAFQVVDGYKHAISGIFVNYLTNVSWHVSFIYEDHVSHKWKAVWDYIRAYKNVFLGPWIILGDFNVVAYSAKKEGGNPVLIRHMEDFVQFINDLDMIDLGFSGPSFTWSNNILGDANIRERLDRAIANSEWLDIFPLAYSDHVALAVYFSGVVDNGPKPFRFHDMWCKERRGY